METNILDTLNNLGYQGALSDRDFSEVLEGGLKCLEFTKLVYILADELKKLCQLQQTVSQMNSMDQRNSFSLELNSFLKELRCPYKCLVTEHMATYLQTKEDCLLLIDYMISEVMAARIVRMNSPKEKETNEMEIVTKESPTAKDLKEILISLKLKKPPPNITPEMLFNKLEAKLKYILEKEGNKLVGKPLYEKPLSQIEWKELESTYIKMYEEYCLKREALITSSESTKIQKKDTIQSLPRPKREALRVKPNVKLSDFLAARTSLLQVEKTSSASVRKNTQSEVKEVIIGQVVSEGSWDGRSNGGGGSVQGGGKQEQTSSQTMPAAFIQNQGKYQTSEAPPETSRPAAVLAVGDSTGGLITLPSQTEQLNGHAETLIKDNPLPRTSDSAVPAGGARKRLCGSARKRFRRLMAVGKTFEEARSLCVLPLEMLPDLEGVQVEPMGKTAKKRPNENTSLPDAQPAKIPNTQPCPTPPTEIRHSPKQLPNPVIPTPSPAPLHHNPLPTVETVENWDHPIPTRKNAGNFEKLPAFFRVGIENSIRPMTNEELQLVKEGILRLCDAAGKGEGPSFLECSERAGWLLLICANIRSKQWLFANINRVVPWQGAKLRISHRHPKPRIGVAWIPDQEVDQRTLLRRFEIQNVGIDCSLWRVLIRKTEQKGQTVTFSLDESSYETIQSRNGKLFLNFGVIQFRLKSLKGQETDW